MLARLNTRPSPNTKKTASRTVRPPSARHGGGKPPDPACPGPVSTRLHGNRTRPCTQLPTDPRRAGWRDLPHDERTGIASKKEGLQAPAAERRRAKDAISTALTRCLDGPVGHRRLGQSNDDQRQAQPFAIGAVSSSSPLYGRPHRSLKAGRNDSGPMRPLDYPSCRLSISVPHMPRTPSLSTTLESSGITPTGASPEITRSCDRPPLAHRPRRSGEPTVRTDHGTLKA